jgi:hypothetical protein
MSVHLVALGSATFAGLTGAGSISVPGLKVGDKVVIIHNDTVGGNYDPPGNNFEVVISVAGQIQQVGSNDISADTFTIFFFRAT